MICRLLRRIEFHQDTKMTRAVRTQNNLIYWLVFLFRVHYYVSGWRRCKKWFAAYSIITPVLLLTSCVAGDCGKKFSPCQPLWFPSAPLGWVPCVAARPLPHKGSRGQHYPCVEEDSLNSLGKEEIHIFSIVDVDEQNPMKHTAHWNSTNFVHVFKWQDTLSFK